jgi:hypothetical protein
MMLLTICFPTIVGREKQFEYIFNKIGNQVRDLGLIEEVNAVHFKDNKEISIGMKRDSMYKQATGLFSVQIDDDDDVADDFVKSIYDAIKENPDVDCIGYMERCIMDGVTKYSKISNEFNDWATTSTGYERTPFFKVPIKTSICQQVGVSDIRFGEDHDFAQRAKPFIKTQTFIDKALYYYTGNSLTAEQHKERYGL